MSFQPACQLSELGDLPLAVTLDGHELVMVRVGDEVFCLDNECSHGHVELSEGDVDASECSLECYLHGARFDLRTGAALNLPATQPVATHPVRVEGEAVLVDVDPTASEEN